MAMPVCGCLIWSIKESTVGIVTRLGAYKKSLQPGGPYCIDPCFESVQYIVNLRQLQVPIVVRTKVDKAEITLTVKVQYRVVNTEEGIRLSQFSLSNPVQQITAYVQDVLRSAVSDLTVEQVFDSKDEIGKEVFESLSKQMHTFGYEILQTLVTDVGPQLLLPHCYCCCSEMRNLLSLTITMPSLLLLLLTCSATATATATATTAATATATAPSSLVASACARARFPGPCVRSLAHASPRTPTDLAIASVAASLSSARSAASDLRSGAPSPLPQGPLRDCIQQLSDSADQLERTRAELSRLRAQAATYSRMQLDNACTWVSAALTNEDTCLDGAKRMGAGTARDALTARVRALEKETSNALYFVTHLGGPRRHL